MKPSMIKKVQAWTEIEAKMKQLKSQEMKMRKEICDELFQGRVGTFTVNEELKKLGIKLTAASKTTLSLDKEELENMVLTPAQEACIKYTPSLLKTGLDNLEEDDELFSIITEKAAAPSLKATALKD